MIVVWILLGLLGLCLILLAAAVVRTLALGHKVSAYVPAPDPERAERYAEKLARMVRCETVSRPGEEQREKFLMQYRRRHKRLVGRCIIEPVNIIALIETTEELVGFGFLGRENTVDILVLSCCKFQIPIDQLFVQFNPFVGTKIAHQLHADVAELLLV